MLRFCFARLRTTDYKTTVGGGSLIIDTLISTIVDQISLAAIKQVYKDTLISTSKYLRQLLKIALQVIYGILTSSMLLSLERANA